ncbi:hypothetical protein Tco_0051958 [Tanacetum coccineum]
MLNPVHRYDAVMDASSISAFDAFFLTCNVCLKSPLRIMLLPPNKAYGLSKIFFRQLSSCKLRGILNRECAVLPDDNSNDAIPEDATASTILSSKRRAHVMDFHRKVLLVPP